MTPKQMQLAIDRIHSTAETALDKVLVSAREKYVIPFCNRHKCRFSAGMGTWTFTGGDLIGKYAADDDESVLGKRLYVVLTASYPLNPGQSCGSLMQDYTPPNFKN